MMNEGIIVLTTLPGMDEAKALARELTSSKLAACVNIMPRMTSVYEWKGESQEGEEHLLIIKTRKERYAQIERRISDTHPYELPEIIATPITHGLPGYLNWIEENTQ